MSQLTVKTGTETAIAHTVTWTIPSDTHKWLFVIEDGDCPEMFVETLTPQAYEQRMKAIRDKGHYVAAYNITAIENHGNMLTLDDFLKDEE